MKAILLKDIGDISSCDISKPESIPGEALVKVMASGICGSDVKRVYKDGAHNMPLVIGHEFAGIVESVGENVSEEWIGKRVSVFPLIPCRKCPQCLKKNYEMCEHYNYLGSRRDGGMAEYVSVPDWNLMELPEGVSYEQAAMMEPMAVAVHAMRKVTTNDSDNVFVCGLGTIGILLAMFLAERGIKNLYVIGNKDIQRTAAKKIGIQEDNFCDVRTMNPREFVMEKTSGIGADVYYECIGTNEAINNAIDLTAPAGRVCYVGNPASDIAMDMKIYWQILRKQLTLCGTWNSSYMGEGAADIDNCQDNKQHDDWCYCLDKLEKGVIHPEMIISHRYDIQNIIEGLEIMRDKKEEYMKIMLVN